MPTVSVMLRRMLPTRLRRAARQRGLASWPPRGAIRFGSLRRTSPISSSFGFDRGTPVDRHYIASFLREHADDVRGRVLEVGDDRYASAFGGGIVESVSVLNLVATGAANEIVDDLARPKCLQAEAYDCVICVQTLHLIYELKAAVESLRRILRPNGIVLATLPGISQISSDESMSWEDQWRVTCASATRVFGDVFGERNVSVHGYGNVLSAIAFLHGIAAEELQAEELEVRDDSYDLLVGVRARRPAGRHASAGDHT
jgi:SAM-dependent methyltransferase